MIPTFFSARKSFRPHAWAIAGSIALLAWGGGNALAQPSALTPGFLEHPAVTPPPMSAYMRPDSKAGVAGTPTSLTSVLF